MRKKKKKAEEKKSGGWFSGWFGSSEKRKKEEQPGKVQSSFFHWFHLHVHAGNVGFFLGGEGKTGVPGKNLSEQGENQ